MLDEVVCYYSSNDSLSSDELTKVIVYNLFAQ